MEMLYWIFLLPLVTLIKAGDPYIEVVISPIVRTDIIGEIRLIWDWENFTIGDRIALYRSNDAIFEYEPYERSGSIETNSFIGNVNFTKSLTTSCTIYTAGYLHKNKTVAYTCLQTAPTWMNDIRNSIENLSLPELLIPGTHDSAAYIISNTGYKENILQKYVYTQDISLYEQLIMGARYLDLRVGYYNPPINRGPDEVPVTWWCNHSLVPLQPLKEMLRQIRNFIMSTNEIVIVDFHHFPVGFRDIDIHEKLAKYIIKEIGDLIHPKSELNYKESLKSIWNSGKRIIVSYNNDKIDDETPFFKPIKQYWGNKQTLPELYSYLNEHVMGCDESREVMWVAMAELTATTISVLVDLYGGLRQMAQQVNTNITLSYRSWGSCSNIVAVDFIRSTGLVRTAIQVNKQKKDRFKDQ